jgi:hypothetical protein
MEAMMPSKWQSAHQQARAIGKCKTEAGKRRAILRWCRTVLENLKERSTDAA